VELAGLDRSSGGDLSGELDQLVALLNGPRTVPATRETA
jgi:hypothetical protein